MAKTYGIQGGPGSFSEEATRQFTKQTGIDPEITYLYTSERVLTAVENGDVDHGLVAIENSVGGVVFETVEALTRHRCEVEEFVDILVVHALVMRPGGNASDIKRIISHPQALKQCQKTLAKRYPEARKEAGKGDAVDQATAAKLLSEGEFDDNTAVLCSRVCADLYDLEIVDTNLQDKEDNYTTFLVIKSL